MVKDIDTVDELLTQPDDIPEEEAAEVLPAEAGGADEAGSEEDSSESAAEENKKPPILKRVINALPGFMERCGFTDKFFARLLGVYLIFSAVNIITLRDTITNSVIYWREYLSEVSMPVTCLMILAGFLLLTVLHFVSPKKLRVLDSFAMFAGTVFFSCTLMWRYNNYYMCIGVILISVVFMCYLAGKTKPEHFEKIPDWLAGIMVFTIAAVVAGFVAVTSVAHHKIFGTSCYDMGIFAQMFHYMLTDFTLETTCERDVLMSHTYVHASFIYYLLLPVYAIFPNENTLLVAQAVLAMGGVVPMYLIAKNHRYKGFALVAVCLIYVFFAGFIGPCYYDFHENAFLPTILMWLLYAVDKRKYILFYITAALTCIVKEDAPLYVICIGLYLLVSEKSWKRFHGMIATGLSGVYFALITKWLTEHGDGVNMMNSRFANLTTDTTAGFGGIITNVLANPGYFVSLFVQEGTLLFLVQIMLSLLGLPLMTKKLHRFLLMIPFIIMNLVIGSHYGYAAGVYYQYIFGPSCLLIYMLVLNCKDMSPEKRNMAVTGSMMACLLTSVCLFSGNIGYVDDYNAGKERFQEIEECLDTIPEDASVACNAWYLPHIAERDELYLFDNGDLDIDENTNVLHGIKSPFRYDFIVMRSTDEHIPEAITMLVLQGFSLYEQTSDGVVVIYKSPDYVLE